MTIVTEEVKSYQFGSTKVNKLSCDSKWLKVLEGDKNGKVVSGSKEDLHHAVVSGSKIRIILDELYSTDTQNVYSLNGEICAQALFHISKGGFDSHQTKAYWWFLNVCTTGNVHMSRWYVGVHQSPSESKVKYNIKWFASVRYNIGSHTSRGKTNYRQRIKWFIDTRPWKHVFSNSASGKSIHGSKTILIQEVKAGKMVRFTVKSASHPQSHHVSVLNADNIGINKDEKDVGAQHIRSIGYSKNGLDSTYLLPPTRTGTF